MMWCRKKTDIVEFIQGVISEFIDSLKNNCTKYLLIFDKSCEKILNSKGFLDFATAERHRGLSTIYNNYNLFHQSKFGPHDELENTHIVLFKSPRDVMQITKLSAQLALGSELVDWYRDATSVSHGNLLTDLSPRTDGRLRFCTNTGSIRSRFHNPARLKQSKFWTMNTQNLSTLQVFQSSSHKFKSLFPQSCPKEFIRFLFECLETFSKETCKALKNITWQMFKAGFDCCL